MKQLAAVKIVGGRGDANAPPPTKPPLAHVSKDAEDDDQQDEPDD